MVQGLRTCMALVEDMTLVSSTHVEWPTVTWNTSSRGTIILWPLKESAFMYPFPHMDTHTHTLK